MSALASAAILSACAGTSDTAPSASSQPADPRPVADIWRARCGNCHERIRPGEHTRQFLTDALKRHHKRVRLNEEKWAEMIDFLAISP